MRQMDTEYRAIPKMLLHSLYERYWLACLISAKKAKKLAEKRLVNNPAIR